MRAGLFILFAVVASVARAQPVPPLPPVPAPFSSSPVDLFRRLLTTNAAGREAWLATRPPATRRIVEGKLREYEMMPAGEREVRLQSLQLRWYMRQLIPLTPADRAPRLATLPEPERNLLRQRLGTWEILPPRLKQELLENERILPLVVAAGGSNRIDALATLPPDQQEELRRQHDRWNELPPERRQQILDRFNYFFELRDDERSRVLARLTDTERAQMEQTFSRFANLSREEREQAMQGFKKFAELTPEEQAAFLRSADRWKAMSEQDRELWRKVVASLRARRPVPPPSLGGTPRPAPTLSSSN